MARFVDLDEEGDDAGRAIQDAIQRKLEQLVNVTARLSVEPPVVEPPPPVSDAITDAFSCYPYASVTWPCLPAAK